MTNAELNSYVIALRNDDGGYYPAAKHWQRIDVGNIETYVGDRLYIVSVVAVKDNDADNHESFVIAVQKRVVRYLSAEGFIDAEFLYIGLQDFKL